MSNNFYIYAHRKLSDNTIFYIGKGSGYRAYSKKSRNKHWMNIVKKHGLNIEIVLINLTEDQAFLK